MIIRFFKSNSRSIAYLLPFWTALMFFRLFIWVPETEAVSVNLQMPLFTAIVSLLPSNNAFMPSITALCLILIQVRLIYNLGSRQLLLEQRTMLPAFIYATLTGFLAAYYSLSPIHFGAIFFILSIKQLIAITKVPDVRSSFFNIGFYLSIGSLFYVGLIPVYIAFWIGLLFAYPFDKKLWIINLLGYLTPIIFYFSFLFLFNFEILTALSSISEAIGKPHSRKIFDVPMYFYFGFLFILLAISGIKQVRLLNVRNITTRRIFITLFFILSLSILFMFIVPGISMEFLFIIAVPIAFLFSDFMLMLQSRFFEETVVISLIVFSIFISIISQNNVFPTF